MNHSAPIEIIGFSRKAMSRTIGYGRLVKRSLRRRSSFENGGGLWPWDAYLSSFMVLGSMGCDWRLQGEYVAEAQHLVALWSFSVAEVSRLIVVEVAEVHCWWNYTRFAAQLGSLK
jgi:hypothetical protein